MPDDQARPSASAPIRHSQLSKLWGLGLVLGLVVALSLYIWNSLDLPAAQPANIVSLQPSLRAYRSEFEFVPYQHEIEPTVAPCPTLPTGQLCLIIEASSSPADPMTFT